MSDIQPYKILCVKGYNMQFETKAWGMLEPLKVYEVYTTPNHENRVLIRNVKVHSHTMIKTETGYSDGFFIALSQDASGATVPFFNDHFIRLPD